MFTKFCSNHEIFTTKIKTFANLERFTKFLCHENLELYGISKRYSKNSRDRSKKSRSRKYNYKIISIIKNVERARARVP